MEVTSFKSSGKQRMSVVWKYFRMDPDESTKVICQLCAERLKFSGSTTSMKYHLRRHASVIGMEIPLPPSKLQKPATIRDAAGAAAAAASVVGLTADSRRDIITAHLISLLALDYHHPSIVEGEGFRALLHFLDPTYLVPSAQTLSRRISLMHEVYRYRLASELAESQEVALGIEKWYGDGSELTTYVTLTVYYITSAWEFRSRVLGTESIGEKGHDNATDIIMSLCKSYNIPETAVVAAVHENDHEVQLSCAFVGWHHFPCFAQTLSNCVNGVFAVAEVADMVATCRNLLECLLANPPLAAVFEVKQKEMGLPRRGRRLQQDRVSNDNSDPWAVTWRMMDIVQEQHIAILQTFQDPMVSVIEADANQLPRLPDEDEWLEVKAVVDALGPLDTVREILCAESHVSLSTVVPILFSLVNVHLQPSQDDKQFIRNLKTMMVNEMKAQFSFDSAAFTESFGIMATVLDPRHKSLPFLNDVQRNVVKTKLMTLVEDNRSMATTITDDLNEGKIRDDASSSFASGGNGGDDDDDDEGGNYEEATKCKPTVAQFLSVIYGGSASIGIGGVDAGTAPNPSKMPRRSTAGLVPLDIRTEVDAYLAEESLPLSDNPLEWWKVHSSKYPTLSKLARRMLCIPATAVRPSQAFAGAQLASSKRRSTLNVNLVDKLVFLNGSLQHGVLPTIEKETQMMQNLASYAQADSDLVTSTDVVIDVP